MNNWQRAFVLHTRPYSESSLLADLFVEHKGKVTLIAKGAKRIKSPLKAVLQPFTPLIVQYSGNSEVKTLKQVEAISLSLPLVSDFLYSAFYLNELIHRVLIGETDTGDLFEHYLLSLRQLAQQTSAEQVLRNFELALLDNLGYRVDFFNCFDTGDAITAFHHYHYLVEHGFTQTKVASESSFTGNEILSIGQRDFDTLDALKAAKRFTRIALKPYVGTKPFKSREFFFKI